MSWKLAVHSKRLSFEFLDFWLLGFEFLSFGQKVEFLPLLTISPILTKNTTRIARLESMLQEKEGRIEEVESVRSRGAILVQNTRDYMTRKEGRVGEVEVYERFLCAKYQRLHDEKIRSCRLKEFCHSLSFCRQVNSCRQKHSQKNST